MNSSYIVRFRVQVRLLDIGGLPIPSHQERFLEKIRTRKSDFVAYCSVDFHTKEAHARCLNDNYYFIDLRQKMNDRVLGKHFWAVREAASGDAMDEAVIAEDGAFRPVADGFVEPVSVDTEPEEGAHTDLWSCLVDKGFLEPEPDEGEPDEGADGGFRKLLREKGFIWDPPLGEHV